MSRITFNIQARQPQNIELTQASRNYSCPPGEKKTFLPRFLSPPLPFANCGGGRWKKDRMKLSIETANLRIKSEIISDNPRPFACRATRISRPRLDGEERKRGEKIYIRVQQGSGFIRKERGKFSFASQLFGISVTAMATRSPFVRIPGWKKGRRMGGYRSLHVFRIIPTFWRIAYSWFSAVRSHVTAIFIPWRTGGEGEKERWFNSYRVDELRDR